METEEIRQKLYYFIATIEDKKAQAIYTLFEEEIEQDELEYSVEFKAELDKRLEYYKNGGRMISSEEVDNEINQILAEK
jgi:hypothetical protein